MVARGGEWEKREEIGQRVDASSFKMNSSNAQHGDYN